MEQPFVVDTSSDSGSFSLKIKLIHAAFLHQNAFFFFLRLKIISLFILEYVGFLSSHVAVT